STTNGALGTLNTWNGYEGAAIGFFGVNNVDLFAEGNDTLRAGLAGLAKALCETTYICSAENKYDCYKQGEKPNIAVSVENLSDTVESATASVVITAEDTGAQVFSDTNTVKIRPGVRRAMSFNWSDCEKFEDDFYYVHIALYGEDGEVIDEYTTGFAVWCDEVIANGPAYTYHDNYIHLVGDDKTETAIYASGVDDGANLFINEDQTPLAWLEDFERRQDAGLYIYENLQQYLVYGDFKFIFASDTSLEKHMRTVDCVVYLAQRYNQIYMMGLAIGNDTAAVDETEKVCEFVKTFAERYKDVPGIIFYLNGDLVCEPDSTANDAFRSYLKARYGTDDVLRDVWNESSASLESVKYDTSYSFGGSGWNDVKAYDQNVFRTALIKEWCTALEDEIDSVTGGSKLILCEFYSWPYQSVDVPCSIGDLGYSNIGYFESTEKFPQTIAYSDQRWQGKSLGIGETNKRTNPLYSDTQSYYESSGYEYARGFFFTTYYTTYALGGNHYQLWCFNDESKYTFSWGMNTGGEHSARDLFYWMRNANFITRSSEPVYETPSVAFVTADSTRLSGSSSSYSNHYAVINALNIAQLTLTDNILTLNESNFDIPDGVEVIFYPLCYTMPDDVYEKLLSWVKDGGTLYISGDFAYDALTRERSNGDRLTELAGVNAERVKYAGTDVSGSAVSYSNGTYQRSGKPNVILTAAGASAVYSTDDGTPVITQYALGNGKVIYNSDPIELFTSESTVQANVALYSYVLSAGNISGSALTCTAPCVLKQFRLPLADGGSFVTVVNSSTENVKAEYVSGNDTYSFSVDASGAGWMRFTSDGSLFAVMYNGKLGMNGSAFINNGTFAAISSLDGLGLTVSKAIAVMPQASGKFSLVSKADWENISVCYGQLYGGKYISGGALAYTLQDGCISFSVPDNAVNCFVIICESGSEDECSTLISTVLQGKAAMKNESDTSESSENKDTSAYYIAGGIIALLACGAALGVVLKIKRSKK
ncbi:MAG TPA: beta-galactosidase trimerization domain-containing protein, partial [Bacillota bacterium]|nr:beta-galactosidase trimerization domain-containing protein [Bacillota bacterium]